MMPSPTPPQNVHALNPEAQDALIEQTIDLSKEEWARRAKLEPQTFTEAMQLAKTYAKAGLYGITDESVAFVILQVGGELGLLTGQSFRALYVIDGKPALYSAAKVALVRRSGLCVKWDIIESTATKCVIEVQRRGGVPIRWTWDRARADAIMHGQYDEGPNKGKPKPLTTKDVWINYPGPMLRHRCESEACDAMFQDVTFGLPSVEEVSDALPATRTATPPASAPRTVDMTPAQKPDASPSTSPITPPAAATPPKLEGVPSPNVSDDAAWVGRYALVQSREELSALVALTPKKAQTAPVVAALAEAKKRLGTKSKAAAEAPVAVAATAAPTPPTAATAADDDPERAAIQSEPSAWTLPSWEAHLLELPNPFAVIAIWGKHCGEFSELVLAKARALAVRRLVQLGDEQDSAHSALVASERRAQP